MNEFLDRIIIGISTFFRFDYENNPYKARKKSLIILLIFFVGLQILAFMSLL